MAGANMSGDLKNPARSIPIGTLAAVGVTAIVYLSQTVCLAGARPSSELIGDNLVIRTISQWPLLITAGVFAATLSSALGLDDGRAADPAGARPRRSIRLADVLRRWQRPGTGAAASDRRDVRSSHRRA